MGQFSKNVAVDALLQYYFTAASGYGFRSEFAFILPESCPLSDTELCTALGNLLKNAIEACHCYKGDNKYIQIITECSSHSFILLIINSYDGNYQKSDGRFLSRKPGVMRFGVGLESVRHTVERYGGTLNVFPEKERFRVRIELRLE